MTESQILADIMLAIGADPRWRVFRQNTGAVKTGDRFIRFNVPGWPDVIVLFRGGGFAFIEVKAANGRLSEEQVTFQALCERMGWPHLVARDVASAVGFIYNIWARMPVDKPSQGNA